MVFQTHSMSLSASLHSDNFPWTQSGHNPEQSGFWRGGGGGRNGYYKAVHRGSVFTIGEKVPSFGSLLSSSLTQTQHQI